MLPYELFWEHIELIQNTFRLPFNLSSTSLGEFSIEDVIEITQEYYVSVTDHLAMLETVLQTCPSIDFTYRLKESSSILRKWSNRNPNMPRPLFKVFNDMIGLRLVLNASQEMLFLVKDQLLQTCPGSFRANVADLSEGKSRNDGYKGIHIYVRKDNHVFPIEIQLWTRSHALLNEYLRANIYTIHDHDSDVIDYAIELRSWLDNVPVPPSEALTSYIDFLYELAFYDKTDEEEEYRE
jgi:hypothetical protein